MKIVLENDEAISYMMEKLNTVHENALGKADEEIAALREQLKVALDYSKTLEGKKKPKKAK